MVLKRSLRPRSAIGAQEHPRSPDSPNKTRPDLGKTSTPVAGVVDTSWGICMTHQRTAESLLVEASNRQPHVLRFSTVSQPIVGGDVRMHRLEVAMKFLLAFVLVCTAACTGTPPTAHCSAVSPDGGAPMCTEYTGLTADQVSLFSANCRTLSSDAGVLVQAQWQNSPCSRESSVGGCRQQSGGFAVTTWYPTLGGATEMTLRSACEQVGGTWVPR